MKKIFFVVLMFMLMFVFTGRGFAQENQKTGELVKKIYVVYLGGDTSKGMITYILEDIELTEFNGIKCLKGKHSNISWVANKTVYLPVDKILGIVEYDSLNQYKEDIEKSNKRDIEP